MNALQQCLENSNHKSTPLHEALVDLSTERLQSVLDEGLVDINAVDFLGRTVLHWAVIVAIWREGVKFLLDKGANVNAKDEEGNTPLCYASDTEEISETLLERGADIECQNNRGETPLHIAVLRNEDLKVIFLLAKGAKVIAKDMHDQTPLDYATKNENVFLVLLQKGGEFDHYKEFDKTTGKTLLHLAVEANFKSVINVLLEKGFDVNVKDWTNMTPLHYASSENHGLLITILLKKGADIESTDEVGSTPLHLAAKNSCGLAVETLLANGCDVNAKNKDNDTPLHLNISFNPEVHLNNVVNVNVIKTLLDNGADINSKNTKGQAAVHLAVLRCCKPGLDVLLERGSEINARDNEGRTPLHVAVLELQSGYTPQPDKTTIIEQLLIYGANIDEKDDNGQTPLHLSVKLAMNSVYLPFTHELLIGRGADIRAQDDNGNSPLHLAALDMNRSAVTTLVEAGADINCRNEENQTPLALVLTSRYSQYDMLELFLIFLMDKGANINLEDKDGNTALHITVARHNTTLAIVFLDRGANLKHKNKNGHTPLHMAFCGLPEYNMCELLLSRDADVNVKDVVGKTPLHLAVEKFKDHYIQPTTKLIELLLEKGANLDDQDINGDTPLHYSMRPDFDSDFIGLDIKTRKEELVKKLIAKGATLDVKDGKGQTALHAAAVLQYLENEQIVNIRPKQRVGITVSDNNNAIIEQLLSLKVEVNSSDKFSQTPLHLAAQKGYLKRCALLLQKGAEINVKDISGNTPLHNAARSRNGELVEKLLMEGAHFEIENENGLTPLHICVEMNLEPAVHLLLARGAKVNVKDKYNNSPLHFAALPYDRYELVPIGIVKQLLDEGADVNSRNDNGETPLMLFLMKSKGHIPNPVITLLVERGAEINTKYKNCNTFLHLAVKLDNFELVEKTLATGVEIDETDSNGQTALHTAAQHRALVVVNGLLEAGAEVNAQDNWGQTPLHLTAHSQMAEYLLDWGASLYIPDNKGRKPLDSFYWEEKKQRVLEQHTIKPKFLYFNVSHDANSDNLDSFKVECFEEIEKMKADKFNRNTLLDIFHKFRDPTFLTNAEMERRIKSYDLVDEYPIYVSLLKAYFIKGKKRRTLLDIAQNSFNTPFPNEIVRKILSYLDNEDLESVVKANTEF